MFFFVQFLFVLMTICLLGIAAYTLLRDHLNNDPARTSLLSDPSQNNTPILPFLSPDKMSNLPDPVAKGKAFEKFVVTKFDPKYFEFLEWRGDKFHKGMYPLSNKNPDLEYAFHHKQHHVRFAVECKWRFEFRDDAIKWTDAIQMEHYQSYQSQEQIPVFVVIGVGGTPAQPNELYIVPLDKMHKDQLYLTSRFLQPFSRSTSSSFFLDAYALRLK